MNADESIFATKRFCLFLHGSESLVREIICANRRYLRIVVLKKGGQFDARLNTRTVAVLCGSTCLWLSRACVRRKIFEKESFLFPFAHGIGYTIPANKKGSMSALTLIEPVRRSW